MGTPRQPTRPRPPPRPPVAGGTAPPDWSRVPYDTSRYSAAEASAASMLLVLLRRLATAPPPARTSASTAAGQPGPPLLPPSRVVSPPPRSAGLAGAGAGAAGARRGPLPPPPPPPASRRAGGPGAGVSLPVPPPPARSAAGGAGHRKPPPAPPRSPSAVAKAAAHSLPCSPRGSGATPSSSSLSSGAGAESVPPPPSRAVLVKKRSRPPPPRASSPTGVVAVDGREVLAAAASVKPPPPKRAKKAGGTGSPVGVPGSNESRRVQPSTEVACRVRDLGCPGGWTWILGTVQSYAPDVKKYHVADAACELDAEADGEAKPEGSHPSTQRRALGKRHAVPRKQLSVLSAEPPVPHAPGSRVLAMYPDTTTFYPATILSCPPSSPVSDGGAGPKARPAPRQGSYLLNFDDEEGGGSETVVKSVAARYVTSLAARRTR